MSDETSGDNALQDSINHRDNALEDIKAKADKLAEALLDCRFEFEMISKHGGYNHLVIPRIDEALQEYRGEQGRRKTGG